MPTFQNSFMDLHCNPCRTFDCRSDESKFGMVKILSEVIMGLFDFLKKYKKGNADVTRFDIIVKTGAKPTSKPPVDMEHLTDEGDLPWGWILHNKEFTEKIGCEYSHFLNSWIDARKKSPKELYPALKSFVLYLEDAEKLCISMGECFEYWFYGLIASKDYIEKRKNELKELTENLDELQQIYEKKQQLFPSVVNLLKANDGILQSEFKNLFDEPFQNDVTNILYHLHKEGKLERTKEGRSYILHFRG